MTDTRKKAQALNPLAVGLTGVVIGAAGAAVIALSDEPTRKRASKKAIQMKSSLREWSTAQLAALRTRNNAAKEILSDVKQDMADDMEEVKNISNS